MIEVIAGVAAMLLAGALTLAMFAVGGLLVWGFLVWVRDAIRAAVK